MTHDSRSGRAQARSPLGIDSRPTLENPLRFTPTSIDGAFIVDLEPLGDDRGFFARAFCRREFEEAGLDPAVVESMGVQCNLSTNGRAGTLRGMHYQDDSAPEPKLIRCTRGAIWDVIIDMRPDSPTYREHFGVELSEDNRRQLFVPALCAHGYQTLTDDTEIFYMVGHAYTPGAERGLRWNDPAFGIDWPLEVTEISDKDGAWPLFEADEAGRGAE